MVYECSRKIVSKDHDQKTKYNSNFQAVMQKSSFCSIFITVLVQSHIVQLTKQHIIKQQNNSPKDVLNTLTLHTANDKNK